MRINRETLILIVVSVVVLVAMLVLSNQQASAPGNGSPTPTPSAGPIFPEIADVGNQSNIVRYEVTSTADNSKVVMTKDDAGVWTIAEATNAQQLATDQTKAVGTMSVLASLTALDKFETDKPADFGLDAPKHVMVLTDKEGKTYTLKIGNQAVANPRYYGLVNDDTKTVYVLPKDLVDGLTGQITQPAYVASPTPTTTPTATPNPYSEVEMTATAQAAQDAFIATLTATVQTPAAEVTTEVTPEVTTAP